MIEPNDIDRLHDEARKANKRLRKAAHKALSELDETRIELKTQTARLRDSMAVSGHVASALLDLYQSTDPKDDTKQRAAARSALRKYFAMNENDRSFVPTTIPKDLDPRLGRALGSGSVG